MKLYNQRTNILRGVNARFNIWRTNGNQRSG